MGVSFQAVIGRVRYDKDLGCDGNITRSNLPVSPLGQQALRQRVVLLLYD
jgi:hypothetical protein